MTTSRVRIENPKEHFILNDSFNNIVYDIDFSVFKKYMCRAGCNICYIQDDWIPPDRFQRYIPIRTGGKTRIDRLMNVFSHFEIVSSIDDLRFVRDEHPELFRFYQEYGSVFHLSSMTDNAIFRHLPIIVNGEVKPKGIREISVSEFFLARVKTTKLLIALSQILHKSPILKIKAILAEDSLKPEASIALADWCKTNGVELEKQFEHGADGSKSNSILSDIANSRISEDTGFTESSTYSEGFGEIYPIHSEILFLMYDGFYSELKSATKEGRSVPFATLADFDDPIRFLPKILEGKLADYRRYVDVIQNKDNDYYRYFKYVVDHLVINHNFNFIPRVAFKPYSPYYNRIVQSGKMIDTHYGLVMPNASPIIPIYTFKDHEPNTI